MQSITVLVDLLFSLVWVPGKRLISLLGLDLKSLGTIALNAHEVLLRTSGGQGFL